MKKGILLKVFLILVIFMSLALIVNTQKAEASTEIITFDSQFYANMNGDLKAVFGYDYNLLKQHWLNCGINEGRKASIVYDANYYLNNNADLKAAFGNNYRAAYEHFVNCGINEGRKASLIFDVQAYLNNNADLKAAFGNNYRAAYEHFVNCGINEGRNASAIFNVRYYLENNADLKAAFGNNYRAAYEHFMNCGIKEGRNTSAEFNVRYYLENNADLKAAFGNNYEAAYNHYLTFGISEGRKAVGITSPSNPTPSKWSYKTDSNGKNSIITNGIIELSIGDKINYNPTAGLSANAVTTYTSTAENNGYGEQTFALTGNVTSYDTSKYSWNVMGVDDKGQLLILSEEFLQPVEGGYAADTREYYSLVGQKGYKNAVTELNAICSLYGQGYGATGGRTITVEDVNKITGYVPEIDKYGEGTLSEYGSKVTYYWDGTEYPYYETTNGLTGKLSVTHSNGFNWFDTSMQSWGKSSQSMTATLENKEKITTLTNNYYYYNPNTVATDLAGTTVGIDATSKEYYMLFTDSNNSTTNYNYWLGSTYIFAGSGFANFGMRRAYSGLIDCVVLYYAHDYSLSVNSGVRAVVSLSSGIQLTGNSTEGWNIVK